MDYAEAAIGEAWVRAKYTGVQVNFIVDDLTNWRYVSGTFDFLPDYDVLDDLRFDQGESYLFLSTYRTGCQNE